MSDRRPDDRVRFVFFDVGGTLLRVQPSVGEVYSRTAAEHGLDVAADWLAARFRRAWRGYLERSLERSHVCSDAILREEWSAIVRGTFGGSIPDANFPALFEDLYEQFVSASAWTVAGKAREAFECLRALGARLGILSNWDSRLPRTLEQLGLAGLFDVHVISYEVGYEKPHPHIFEEAVSRAGENPERILFVGDSWETDIRPARRLGMKTLWIAPEGERIQQPDGGPGVESFGSLSPGDWETLLAVRREGKT